MRERGGRERGGGCVMCERGEGVSDRKRVRYDNLIGRVQEKGSVI